MERILNGVIPADTALAMKNDCTQNYHYHSQIIIFVKRSPIAKCWSMVEIVNRGDEVDSGTYTAIPVDQKIGLLFGFLIL